MKLRIRPGIPMDKMSTPYGIITKEWRDFPEGSYVYKELEMFGIEPAPSSAIAPSPTIEAEPPVNESDYADELAAIPGVGGKTVLDIKKIYKTEEDLIKALRNMPDAVPLRDDVVLKLQKHYRIR